MFHRMKQISYVAINHGPTDPLHLVISISSLTQYHYKVLTLPFAQGMISSATQGGSSLRFLLSCPELTQILLHFYSYRTEVPTHCHVILMACPYPGPVPPK